MLIGIDSTCNDVKLIRTPCPHCGARGRYKRHGSYKRYLVDVNDSKPIEARIVITRVRCLSCRRTHALLPSNAVAHSSLSVSFCASVLAAYLGPTQTVETVSFQHGVSARTIYRIASGLTKIRCVIGMGVSLEQTQKRLIAIVNNAEILTSFVAEFLFKFAATPFQYVTLPKVTLWCDGGIAAIT